MKLRVINPTVTTAWVPEVLTLFGEAVHGDAEISVATIPAGTPSIECRRDEALVTPWVLLAAQQAEADGCDAIAVDCALDPGVHAAREVVDIPVLGPGEASMHIAATLGRSFSVISVAQHQRNLVVEQARRYGLESRLASVRSLDIPVLQLDDEDERTVKAMVRRASEAVELDNAEAIVLGCTGLAARAEKLQGLLAAAGHDVPVINPLAAVANLLETAVSMGVSSSRVTYAKRPGKTAAWPTDNIRAQSESRASDGN